MIQIIRKEEQANGAFNGGAILEKKPVGFLQDGGKLRPYSNLFYWAHAWSDEGSTIGLHPHQGFEIMTFVIEGEINHYDTKIQKWRNLKKGDVQIIRAGNGVSHAERLEAGAHIFQIWFDPDLSRSIYKQASYDDFNKDSFPSQWFRESFIITYVGENAPVKLDSDIVIKEAFIPIGLTQLEKPDKYVTSVFIIEGQLKVKNEILNKGDFFILKKEMTNIEILVDCRLFLVHNPEKIEYKTYAEQYYK
jgi:hypothetical protein